GSGRSIPFLETFPGATLATGWSISNPDAATTWGFRTGVTPAGTSTPMVWIDLFDYNAAGQEDGLVSPVIDLVGISNPVVSFDVSYARYSTTLFDKLRVDISTDCGLTFTNGIYLKENLVLATAGTVTTPFTPSTAAQWRRDSISLSNYAGQKIRLRFSSINGYGNNLYLANIRVNGQASAPSVTGNLRYLNTALTPFTNASIRLMQGTAQIASASTGSTGDFSFSAPSGSYGLKINTQKPWGGGNATDALFINRHFTGTSPLSGLPLLASDVNASGTVNSSDALIIMRRFTTHIDSFAAGNWILSPSSVTLPQSGSLGLNVLAMGDVNGSYVPDVNLRTAYQPLGYLPSEWRMEEDPSGISGLFVDQDALIGAVSLDLLMPEGCVVEEVLGVAAWDACTWKQVGRTFRLAAYRQSGIPLTRGEALLRIRTSGKLGNVAINKQHSEFSDILGNPLNHLSLFQRLDGATQSSLFEPLRIYPNPSSGIVQVDLPKGVALESVSLFDALGRMVLSFDANEIKLNPSGAELELSTLAEGTYRIDLKATSKHGAFMGHALLVKR
ncbi:MAG: choice-of-anchor J domain-containing protein, partial [Bacteroidota bacterium]